MTEAVEKNWINVIVSHSNYFLVTLLLYTKTKYFLLSQGKRSEHVTYSNGCYVY